MFKKYFKRKSVLGIVIDVFIAILFILILLPVTRKQTLALMLKPTLFIHQPKVNKVKEHLTEDAYSWQLIDITGERIRFDRFKGKVIFINLWATWCPPCIAELPDLQKIYNEYGDRVIFLFISNENKNIVNSFLQKKRFNIPVYMPITEYPVDFETNSIPTSFLINKKGEIIIAKKGVAQWNSRRIRKVLDSLIE